ncbi:MAG: helix-turn-helix transcriptional regulator [Clostridia bacterium]|nr:helix-turn-helix transcriptional regulator [Clostridia bacterium]
MNNTQEAINFCKNVKAIRNRNALDIETMANYIGVSPRELMDIEKGEIPFYLSVSVLFNIYFNFGVSPQIIFRSPDDTPIY